MTDTLNPELVDGMRRLTQQLVTRLAAGERFDNPKFTALADDAFGGTRTQGAYTCRDAYDALEVAVNRFLLESKARFFMQAGARGVSKSSRPHGAVADPDRPDGRAD